MRDHLQEYLEKTPGGMCVILDLMFHEECTPNEPSMSSYIGLDHEYQRLKKLLSEPNSSHTQEQQSK